MKADRELIMISPPHTLPHHPCSINLRLLATDAACSMPALAPSAAALRRAGGLALRLRLRLRRRLRSEPRLRERDLRRRLDDGLTARMQADGCFFHLTCMAEHSQEVDCQHARKNCIL